MDWPSSLRQNASSTALEKKEVKKHDRKFGGGGSSDSGTELLRICQRHGIDHNDIWVGEKRSQQSEEEIERPNNSANGGTSSFAFFFSLPLLVFPTNSFPTMILWIRKKRANISYKEKDMQPLIPSWLSEKIFLIFFSWLLIEAKGGETMGGPVLPGTKRLHVYEPNGTGAP